MRRHAAKLETALLRVIETHEELAKQLEQAVPEALREKKRKKISVKKTDLRATNTGPSDPA